MAYLKEAKNFYFFAPLNRDRKTIQKAENLYISGGWSRTLENAIAGSGVSHIVVKQWEGGDLNFLARFSDQIKCLWVEERNIRDLSAVNSLRNLENLYLSEFLDQVDFSSLKRLRACGSTARRAVGSLGACPNLEELTLVAPRMKNLLFLMASWELCRNCQV